MKKLNPNAKPYVPSNQKQQRREKTQPQRKNVGLLFSSAPKTSSKVPDWGSQITNIMSQGYGKTLQMYPSTAAYARVYADPFLSEGARLPKFPLLASSLERYFATGVSQLNGAGKGWITVNGAQFIGNNSQSVSYSDAASGDPVGAGAQFANSNSPRTVQQFDTIAAPLTNVEGRLIALGIRVRYTGATYQGQGTVLSAQVTPLAESFSGQNYTDFQKNPGVKERQFNRNNWISVTRHFECEEDALYIRYNTDNSRFIYAGSQGDVSFDDTDRIALYMQGLPNGNYEWEVVGHYEIIGQNLVRRAVTRLDTVGTEQVHSALAQHRFKDKTTPDHNVGGPWSSLVNMIKTGASHMIPMVPQLLTGMLGLL
jgi:hypothetical protein